MIPCPPGRRPDLDAFLRADLAGAVFPLVNLTPAGLPMAGWIATGDGGSVRAFLGLVEGGMALPVAAPDAGPDVWAGAGAALAGRAVMGLLGRPRGVEGLRRALGLEAAPVRHDAEERGFALDLAALAMPPVAGLRLVALDAPRRAQAEGWRAAYEAEVLGSPPDEAAARAPETVGRWIAQGSHRMLLDGGAAVAMTGFNADLGEVVQVGGVWVPPEERGRGRARAAVALHLADARARGARSAVLFAVSAPAARAYAALGFRPAGAMRLVLFDAPQVVAA